MGGLLTSSRERYADAVDFIAKNKTAIFVLAMRAKNH